ncbi:MAG: MEKHLA domain-containing protein [Cyanobium sp.]
MLLVRLEALHRGHRQAFGHGLLPGDPGRPARLMAQELFAASLVVLAHDGGDDPRLLYANAAALRLWRRPWSGMVGLPSRLTAEPQERRARAAALDGARLSGGIRCYGGVRIDSRGRRFRIAGARIWSLIAADGSPCGQAAAFADWWWL